jgi:hypothetical protein
MWGPSFRNYINCTRGVEETAGRREWMRMVDEAGLIFRPPGLYIITPGAAERTPGNRFFPTPRGVFALPGPAAPSQPPQQQHLQCQRRPPERIDLRPCLLRGQGSGEALCRPLLLPWTQPVPVEWCAAPCDVHPATCTVNNLCTCMYSAMNSVIN